MIKCFNVHNVHSWSAFLKVLLPHMKISAATVFIRYYHYHQYFQLQSNWNLFLHEPWRNHRLGSSCNWGGFMCNMAKICWGPNHCVTLVEVANCIAAAVNRFRPSPAAYGYLMVYWGKQHFSTIWSTPFKICTQVLIDINYILISKCIWIILLLKES